jgi:nucleoid-associated protein YgaU
MEPQRAAFYVAGPDGEPTGSYYSVMFNPTDLNFTKGVQLAEMNVPGLDAPLQQFVRGQAEKLTVKLFFDTTDRGTGALAKSVTTETDKFYSFVKIDSELHSPPVCIFAWGTSFPGGDLPTNESQRRGWFTGVVESVQQEFTLFSIRGLPLRATLTVAMREYKTLSTQRTQLDLHSRDHTKSYVVQRGDTISAIAGRAYGNPADWRAIAEHNGIVDPRRLAAGQALELPRIDRGTAVAPPPGSAEARA